MGNGFSAHSRSPSSPRGGPARSRKRASTSARGDTGAKLVFLSGPKEGDEFALTSGDVVLGRSNDNTVPIPDGSVSRRHVLLRRSSRGWLAMDMGSGNGTLVNGEPISEETLLKSGDVISIGDTEVSFVDEDGGTDNPELRSTPVPRRGRPSGENGLALRRDGALARPRASSGRIQRISRGSNAAVDPRVQARRRQKLKIAGAVGAGLLLLLVGIKGWQRYQRMVHQRAAEAEVARRVELGSIFQEGKNLVREGKWAEAKLKFEELYALNPSYPTLQDYLERANREIPNQRNLAAATKALDDNQVGPARLALDKVTPDTQMFELLRSLRARLDDKLARRLESARILVESDGVNDAEKMKQLDEITADILVGYPGHRDATELSKTAKDRLAVLTRPAPGPVVVTPKPWTDAAAKYRQGDLSAAFAMASQCAKKASQCRAMVEQLQSFNEDYTRIEQLSLKELEALAELDAKLSFGESSAPGKQVGTRLGTLYFKSAASAKAAGDWGKAMVFAKRAMKASPGHEGASGIVSEMRGKAKDLYIRAYAAARDGNEDEAAKMFKEVVDITPESDPEHAKAKGWLQKLER